MSDDFDKAIQLATEIGNLKGRLETCQHYSTIQENTIISLREELSEMRDRAVASEARLADATKILNDMSKAVR